MTIRRQSQISLDHTPYYHCIARCVRRAFLCGDDHYTGKNFNHRRGWLVERLKLHASVFGIDICAYAIMSNHYHVVLRVDRKRVKQWSDDEVIARWTRLFRGPILVQRRLAGEPLSEAETASVIDIAAIWRHRLYDISWFMRCLNETIARQANAEDDCRGRFWEGRFKSQALLDETALLSCMAYVDLNPIRAGMALTLEGSDFTSVQARLKDLAASRPSPELDTKAHSLLPFSEGVQSQTTTTGIPFRLNEYIALVDATGRCLRPGKRGFIPPGDMSLLDQLPLRGDQWLELVLDIHAASLQAIGAMVRLDGYKTATGRRWLCGARKLKRIYAVV